MGAVHAGILGSQASHTPSDSVGVTDPFQAGEFEQGDQTQPASSPSQRRLNAQAIGPNVLAPVDVPAQPAEEQSTARRAWPVIRERHEGE